MKPKETSLNTKSTKPVLAAAVVVVVVEILERGVLIIESMFDLMECFMTTETKLRSIYLFVCLCFFVQIISLTMMSV